MDTKSEFAEVLIQLEQTGSSHMHSKPKQRIGFWEV